MSQAYAALTMASREEPLLGAVWPLAAAARVYGPGATQDAVARTFSNELAQELNEVVAVDNRAGAGRP
jgi:tripartite-type tricarboxylate transporter receptor subunit TctC